MYDNSVIIEVNGQKTITQYYYFSTDLNSFTTMK